VRTIIIFHVAQFSIADFFPPNTKMAGRKVGQLLAARPTATITDHTITITIQQ
jgi:hypothetical protein